jgi:hypothetical protein
MNTSPELPLDKQIKIAEDINASGILPTGWGELNLSETRYYFYKFMNALFWRTLCVRPDGKYPKLAEMWNGWTGKIAYQFHKRLCRKCASR